MSIKTIKTEAYEDQAIASTGLRRRVEQFKRKAYLENIIQSVFDIHTLLSGNTIVIGGDGRFFNKQAIQTVLKMAAANGVARAIVGQHGLLSTPAASYIIRKYGAAGGFILTAGCNPGGKKGDFGIKLNLKCGGPSDDVLNEEIFQHSRTLKEYKIDKSSDVKLEKLGIYPLGTMQVEVIDPVMDYADLMQSIFDFPMLKQAFADGKIKLVADLINGVGGIYVEEIFIRRLGTPLDSFENLESKDTFSGKTISLTPDDLTHLVNKVVDTTPYHLLAVVDPDADRCLMFSDKCLLSSGDNLALLTQYSHLLKPYRDGLIGVARSYTTSQAVDGVAKSLKIPCYEIPNGWQFFARLLESNLVNICGEAASAVGADHNREKDAIWSIL
ncbi:MAG: alpha-D-glucose phosphate-specific phosphoglucomutase, partial [Gammaproteobacteria bacterium]|nr:alpha-D-glucose phosphate-specific phosphoglucomutase [Gammaproteobacteria bacterium]